LQAEELGKKMGVTKQTISNLENGKTPMNFTQYVAIRTILDYEIENNEVNKILPQIVTIFLDKGNELDDVNYSKIRESANTVAASSISGISTAKLIPVFEMLLSSLAIPIISSIVANPSISKNYINKKTGGK